MSIKNRLKAVLPATVQNILRAILRKLKPTLTPMQQVLSELKKRKVRLKDLHALEVFGYHGEWHTMDYASQVSTLEVWDIEQECEDALKRNLPMAEVKITDIYKEIKNTSRKYNLIVIDNPMSIYDDHCEHFDLFPDIFRIVMDSTILILNVIPEIDDAALKKYSYLFNEVQLARRKSFYKTNHPEKVSFDEMIKAYKNLIETNSFNLEYYFFQKRNFIYYLVLKIDRNRKTRQI